MLRTAAAILLASAAALASGEARAADWPTAEDCMLYDAAFKAVVGGEQAAEGKARRVAFNASDRPLDLPAGDPGLGSALNLKVCIALKERVYAAGMTFEGRPPFGLRLPGTAYYEHFSRTSTQGGKVRVTYWLQDDKGFDVTLSRSPDGGWVVEKVETWGVVAMR